MWPIPTLKNEFVSVFFSSHTIACSWIQKTATGSAPFVLRAYQRYPLDNLESVHLIPFNPTKIKKYISSFLSEHQLHNAFITFCLDGVAEKYCMLSSSAPHRADFAIADGSNLQWEYRYLYPHHDGHYIFYTYAISRSLILQYELLAIGLRCNLVGITTKTMALLDAYKNVFGPVFRKSQLAVDMMRYDNNVEDLVSIDALRRMIHSDNHVAFENEKLFIAAACGLFCSERR